MNFWCRVFGWDESEWKRVVHIWGIRFTYKGNRYVIRPGTWLWFLIYIVEVLLATFILGLFCVLLIMALY